MIFSVVAPQFNSPTNTRYRRNNVSTFKRLFPDEDCCHFVSDPRRRWISKVRRCAAAFANSECQPNSYTYTYGNADSNRNRQPDTYSNAHTCCHSAPAFWPAHFALTRAPRSSVAQPDFPTATHLSISGSRGASFEFFADSRNQKPAEANTKAGLCWFVGWPSE